jgi:predicted metalloenzyme YecM
VDSARGNRQGLCSTSAPDPFRGIGRRTTASKRRSDVTDPIADIIGDCRAFAALQRDRLLARGIDIAPYELSHLAFRAPELDQYVHARTLLERHAVANRENFWNGRPISLIVPAQPLEVLEGIVVPLIELIPPVHQRVYKMGLEHLGVVVGDTFDAFVERTSLPSRDSSHRAESLCTA